MRRKSLVHAASLAGLLLVLSGTAASAGSPGPATTAGTSHVFHAFANSPTAQGIGIIRADENTGTLIANLYFRRLAASSQYRISVNARGCGGTTTPATHATAVFFVTSDAKGEVFVAGGHTLGEVAAWNGTASLSIWEAWAGQSRRFCREGFDMHVAGPNQAVGTCFWLGVISSGSIKGIYTGDCNQGESSEKEDSFFFAVPAANHQYRLTINRHACSQNTPNQNQFSGFKVTSDANGRIFHKATQTRANSAPGPEFSVSIYDGWVNQNRVACIKGTTYNG